MQDEEPKMTAAQQRKWDDYVAQSAEDELVRQEAHTDAHKAMKEHEEEFMKLLKYISREADLYERTFDKPYKMNIINRKFGRRLTACLGPSYMIHLRVLVPLYTECTLELTETGASLWISKKKGRELFMAEV